MATPEERFGTWRQMALIMDGKQIPTGRRVILDSGPDGYTVKVGGKVYQRGTSKVVNTDSGPLQGDVLVREGPHAGKTILQIFKIEGDLLISCQALPGAARPTEFTSRPGSSQVLSVWVRVRPTEEVPQPIPVKLVIVLVLLAGVIGGIGEEASERVGRWAGLLAGGVAGIAIVTAICLVMRWTWRAGLVAGVAIITADTTFKELKSAVSTALDPPWTVLVSGCTALVLGALAWMVTSRLLRIDPHSLQTLDT